MNAAELRAWTSANARARHAHLTETTCPRCGGDTTPNPFGRPRVCCKED